MQPHKHLSNLNYRPAKRMSSNQNPTSYRLSPVVTDTVFPMLERILNILTLATAPVLPISIGFVILTSSQENILFPILSLLATVLCALGLFARFVAPRQLRVTNLRIPNLPLRVAYFSDLHVNRIKGAAWVERVVDLINRQKPDVILFGGDFYGHPGALPLAALLAPLARLRAPLGVFAVFGNHDHGLHDHDRTDRPDELRALLPKLGITLLHNQSISLSPPGVTSPVRLVGIGELWANDDNADLAFASCEKNDIVLVLAHNPDLMDKIRQHATVFLFGHTHAGQIYLPFAPGLGVPIRGRLYRGEFHLPQGRVYVGAGCGEASLTARLGTWPEIILIQG